LELQPKFFTLVYIPSNLNNKIKSLCSFKNLQKFKKCSTNNSATKKLIHAANCIKNSRKTLLQIPRQWEFVQKTKIN
jgi:hypothetical protein